MEYEGSLPFSQNPATNPPKSSLHLPHHINLRSILKLSSHQHPSFPINIFPSHSPIEISCAFLYSPMHVTCASNSSSLTYPNRHNNIWQELLPTKQFSPTPYAPSSVQILSPAHYSRTPSVYVHALSLTWKTKFHIHTKQQTKWPSNIFCLHTTKREDNDSNLSGTEHSTNLLCS